MSYVNNKSYHQGLKRILNKHMHLVQRLLNVVLKMRLGQ